ncbi:MAG: hypothetical protein K0S01_2106 [Herbinix sp.]|jgi:hypothetical protein|nr:hypothetical protein [Herbinix sp.]
MKVYYSGNFWGHTAYERACDTNSLNVYFQYGGYDWFIPNIYTCSQGIVIDLCRNIPVEAYDSFNQKWSEIDMTALSNEQRSDVEFKDPMSLSISFEAVINDLVAHSYRWSGIGWQPCRQDNNEEVVENLMDTYGLDREATWYIYRLSIPWPMKKRQKIKSFLLKLSTNKESHSCNKHFTCKPDCEPFDVCFLHPTNGESYILHVYSCLQDKLPEHISLDEENEYPKNLCHLQFSTEPVLPPDHIVMVQDCAKSDRPVIKVGIGASKSKGVCAIGIIGGADGPVAVFIGNADKDKVTIRNSCSSLHFEPVQDVEWFISVQITPFEPKQIALL